MEHRIHSYLFLRTKPRGSLSRDQVFFFVAYMPMVASSTVKPVFAAKHKAATNTFFKEIYLH